MSSSLIKGVCFEFISDSATGLYLLNGDDTRFVWLTVVLYLPHFHSSARFWSWNMMHNVISKRMASAYLQMTMIAQQLLLAHAVIHLPMVALTKVKHGLR